MYYKLKKIEPKDNYDLYLEFEDGLSGTVNIGNKLKGPVFGPLKMPEMFRKVIIDAFGAPYWPNGADLAPDALYKTIKKDLP